MHHDNKDNNRNSCLFKTVASSSGQLDCSLHVDIHNELLPYSQHLSLTTVNMIV